MEPALFISRKRARLSTRALDLVIRALARNADLVLSAHTLRHTCLTRLVRGGNRVADNEREPGPCLADDTLAVTSLESLDHRELYA